MTILLPQTCLKTSQPHYFLIKTTTASHNKLVRMLSHAQVPVHTAQAIPTPTASSRKKVNRDTLRYSPAPVPSFSFASRDPPFPSPAPSLSIVTPTSLPSHQLCSPQRSTKTEQNSPLSTRTGPPTTSTLFFFPRSTCVRIHIRLHPY